MTSEVVRKSAFAVLCGVSAGRVSQWISEKKITGDALVGEGRSATIRVEIARAQLRATLDFSQRFGRNGLLTKLGHENVPIHTSSAAPVDSVETQFKAEKLRQARILTSRIVEEDRRQRGVYMLASDVPVEIATVVDEALNIFEGALVEFAAAASAKYSLPECDVLQTLRAEFDPVRAKIAAVRSSK